MKLFSGPMFLHPSINPVAEGAASARYGYHAAQSGFGLTLGNRAAAAVWLTQIAGRPVRTDAFVPALTQEALAARAFKPSQLFAPTTFPYDYDIDTAA